MGMVLKKESVPCNDLEAFRKKIHFRYKNVQNKGISS